MPSRSFCFPLPLRNGITERVRSVSMNFYVSAVASTSPSGVVYRKTADFRKLPTSKAWVFVDEHPDSINDVARYTDMTSPTWVDLPASYHNGACGFSFADGHSEIKKWIAAGTIKPVRYVDWTATGFNAASDPRDIRWVQERTTEKL